MVNHNIDDQSRCPNCSGLLKGEWMNRCENCGTYTIYCKSCARHSLQEWKQVIDLPSIASFCQFCGNPIMGAAFVPKSEIYKHYRYAFKFVNKIRVPFPMYFHGRFPFGIIEMDLGDFVNNFLYEEDKNEKLAQYFGTDIGTARAYKVLFRVDDDEEETIALSHESGLEVFLIAVGAFICVETAKFVLNRTLQTIEKSINDWWMQSRKPGYILDRMPEGDLVDHIAVRTPHWEIVIDGHFSPEERERLIDHIDTILVPHEAIEDFVETIDDPLLAEKTVKASRRIIQRPKKH